MSWRLKDKWYGNIQAHQALPHLWTGQTTFFVKPEYQAIMKQEPEQAYLCHTQKVKGCEIALVLDIDEIEQCSQQTYDKQVCTLAAAAKKQRAEVKEKDLTTKEKQLFLQAKNKEISSRLSTETVRKIARSQIPEDQILRSRWVLTWKPIDPATIEPPKDGETPATHKPKARLVILGYEDPQLENLARDSPTLGKDSRTLIFQYAASSKYKIRSFDIQTAFLCGSRQDGRILGMEPPSEMRTMMKLQPWECCELLKSAYGLVNAPLLWYEELSASLIRLNFKRPFMDSCLFVLPRTDGKGIHGLLGVHVDDGVGAGDKVFEQAIQKLESKYPFGSKSETDFLFTGIHVHQNWDGSIELDQIKYIEDIPTIQIERSRRMTPDATINEAERQSLRGLIGSIQYAATNTRPDASARLSLLQAKINSGQVKDLTEANRLIQELKTFNNVKITYKPIPLDDLRFVSFSDASFANRANAQSRVV